MQSVVTHLQKILSPSKTHTRAQTHAHTHTHTHTPTHTHTHTRTHCNKFIGCLTFQLAFHYSIKGQKLVKVMTNLFFKLVHIFICHLDTEMVFKFNFLTLQFAAV